MEAINHGQKLVDYAGHGSVNQWRGNLLVNEDDAVEVRTARFFSLLKRSPTAGALSSARGQSRRRSSGGIVGLISLRKAN